MNTLRLVTETTVNAMDNSDQADHCAVCGKGMKGAFRAVIESEGEQRSLCSVECLEHWTQQQRLEQDATEFLDLGEFVEEEADRLDGEEQGLEEDVEGEGGQAEEQESFYQEQHETKALGEYGLLDAEEYAKQHQHDEAHEPLKHPLDPYRKTITEEHASEEVKEVPYQPEVVEGKELTEELKKKEQETVKKMLQEMYEQRMKQKAEREQKEGEDGKDDDEPRRNP